MGVDVCAILYCHCDNKDIDALNDMGNAYLFKTSGAKMG